VDTSVPVLVLHQGGNGSLAIARTLGRLGVRVYLAAGDDVSPPTSSRYWSKRFHWNFFGSPGDSVSFLLYVAQSIGSRPILLTTSDWFAIFIEQNAALLSTAFTFPVAQEPVVHALLHKWKMFLLAKKHGISAPDTVYPQSRTQVLEFIDCARFPVVVKLADPFAPQNTHNEIVQNASNLLEKYDRASDAGPANVIFQEYIPGGADSVWMCNAYFDARSECRAIYTGEKLRQSSPTGAASLAICLPNSTVADATRHFMQAVHYKGAVGIGYRYDARDGKYKILDVNARVSGIFRLFRATNGLDIVRICYLDLTGQQTCPTIAPIGRKWLMEEDFLWAARAIRERKITFRAWLTSIRGLRETAIFAIDDPIPLLLWLWWHCNQFFSKARRTLPARLHLLKTQSRAV
jgi:D-aspartate ligase